MPRGPLPSPALFRREGEFPYSLFRRTGIPSSSRMTRSDDQLNCAQLKSEARRVEVLSGEDIGEKNVMRPSSLPCWAARHCEFDRVSQLGETPQQIRSIETFAFTSG